MKAPRLPTITEHSSGVYSLKTFATRTHSRLLRSSPRSSSYQFRQRTGPGPLPRSRLVSQLRSWLRLPGSRLRSRPDPRARSRLRSDSRPFS